MSLIEHLGGYENSKRFLVDVLDSKTPCEILTRGLLEHRRQHNIFEKGDWIVNTKTGAFGDFIKFADTKNGHKHCLVDIGLCDTALFCIKNIRHATDLEIAAGHRL